MVGEDEAAGDTATWKDLGTGRQETVPNDQLAGALRRLLGGAGAPTDG
jgi:histidyl-tRNA synthetase